MRGPRREPRPLPGRWDPRIWERTDVGKKSCRRPLLWVLIRKGDALHDLQHVLRYRLADLQTLNTPFQVCGLEVRVTLRWIKGDLPASQRSGGIHSSGSARYRCIFCLAGSELFTNHVVCLACELRTPASVAATMKKLEDVDCCSAGVVPATPKADEVREMITALGETPGPAKGINKQLQELLRGVKAMPPIWGGDECASTVRGEGGGGWKWRTGQPFPGTPPGEG